MSNIADKARNAGVVGAGGAGFPAYVKLQSSVKFYIANGAECEPLLHKDKELMLAFGDTVLRGLKLAVESVGASRVYFAAKKKYPKSFNLMKKKVDAAGFDMISLGNFYPSGDEYELVWEATRQLIPPGGIPLQVNTVVNNVETLYNIALADEGSPVIDTFVTINGAVRNPGSFWVPVGTPLSVLIEAAGGATVENPAALFNGAMMGSVEHDFDSCLLTRTSAGAIIVPDDHHLVEKKTKPVSHFSRVGKSCCDQCTDCTAMCPRYLLGYAVQPHSVMRSLGFKGSHDQLYDVYGLLCCECNICSLYACPEDLDPKRVCVEAKKALAPEGKGRDFPPSREEVHEMKEHRRVPLDKLTRRLGLKFYDKPAPYNDTPVEPHMVTIPLKQHVGEPAVPLVNAGDIVSRGDVIARPPEDKLGVPVHASISGKVSSVDDFAVTVNAQ